MSSITLSQPSSAAREPTGLGRALFTISSMFAAISAAVAIYGVAVTNAELAELARSGASDSMRYLELMDRTFFEALTAWGGGLAGIALGVVAATRGRNRLGWASAAVALAGAGLAFLLIH